MTVLDSTALVLAAGLAVLGLWQAIRIIVRLELSLFLSSRLNACCSRERYVALRTGPTDSE